MSTTTNNLSECEIIELAYYAATWKTNGIYMEYDKLKTILSEKGVLKRFESSKIIFEYIILFNDNSFPNAPKNVLEAYRGLINKTMTQVRASVLKTIKKLQE